MTDRELLEQVNSKLDALTPRVEALETAVSGSVSHDEVQTVADKENDLESRVTALEGNFSSGNPSDTTAVVSDSNEAAPAQHTIQ